MKKTLLLALVCALGLTAFGQQKIQLRSADKAECVKSDMTTLKAVFSFSSLEADKVETSHGELSEIHIEGAYPNGNVGEPQLPMFTRLIAIPTGATPVVTVGAHSETEYTLSNYGIGTISAMQAPIRKNVEPSTVEYAFNEAAYARNSYNDDPIAMVEVLGTMRGITLGRLIVQPVRYNPAAGTVKVFNDIEVNVDFENGDAVSTAEMFKSTANPAFQSVYDQIFNIDMLMGNRDAYTDHPDFYNTPVKMLVICYSGFQGNAALNSWLQWKLQKGYYVDIYYTSETGTSASSIASFIKTKYNASVSAGNAYTYLIVIGDTGQVPQYMSKSIDSSIGSCASDLGYASVNFSSSTSNYFPDMYYSRISVENTTHLTNYMNKVLTYEKFQFSDGGNFLNNVILVGGWDSSWTSRVAKPTINYATAYYFKSSNTTYGGFGSGNIEATVSTSSTAGYAGSATGTSTTMGNGVYTSINSGVGFLNYTAHGDKQEWYQPKMTAAQVANLTNGDKYFFGVGNCCLTGNFNNTTTTYSPGSSIGTNACFAETMIRVPNAGAIAYVGCSPYSYWYEDFYWAVGAHSYSQGNYPTTSASSKGVYDVMFMDQYWNSASALLYVGNLAVQQAVTNSNTNSSVTSGNCNNSAHYYFQFYHTFGDGSVMPYVTKPEANTVTIPSTVNAGATSITVNAVAGSYVAVTDNSSVIYGVAEANSSGVATVNFTNAIPSSGTLYVVVTRQQYQPYFGTITVGGGSSTTYYTVSASASPTAGGTVTGAGSYASGATCTLTATPATGYEFTKWTKNGTQVSTNATYSFTVSANATYVANFSEVQTPDPDPQTGDVTIGSGTSTNAYLPTYAYYKYSLTEQIYTASEIGGSGTITAVSFKVSNSKSTTRTVDLYLKHTSKTAFTSNTGWETLSSSDKVYSGSVTFNASGWTTITLSTPFVYNGTSNLIIGMDDNTGSYVSSSSNSPKFYVYSTGANRALRIYSDNTNYTPSSATSYSGTYITSNNQVVLTMSGGGTPQVNNYTITATANPTAGGTVTGAGTYEEGSTVTLKATANTGYTFTKWTKNGTQVSTNANYSFTATADAAYVAVFTLNSYSVTATANPTAGGTVSGAGTYNYGTTATLKATASSGYTFTNWTKNGTQVSTNATYSFTVTAAGSYVANFAQEQTTTYYNVTVAQVPNGTVTANKTTAAEGETVTLTVTPNSNCTFYTWVVYKTGDVNTTVTVSNNKFTMPAYDVTVVAVIKPNGTSTGTGGDVTIGSGTSTNAYLPTYAYYKYSLTEQIYTASEIGGAGTITAVSFKVSNSKSTTRTVDLYMKHTTKTAFTSKTGWETLSSSDKVYSGSVTFNASGWTTITLSTPFVYNGTSNLVIGMDDNTGSYVSSSSNSPKFYVYSTSANRALRIYSDNTNYNPASPSSYSGTYITSNNQIMLAMAGSGSTTGSTETIVVAPKTLSGFTYAVGNGPSAVQTFAVIGADLSSNITVTAPSGYEVSTSATSGFGNSVTLSGSKGSRGTQTWGFEGTMDNWTTIDKDGDGYNWQLASVLMSGYNISAHGGSDMLSSESYNKATTTALTPDNWLVSPQVTLGGTFSMYACAQDANYAAEHFGIYVSTSSNTNTNTFVKLGEWTLSAKAQGSWSQFSVDLGAYAGQAGYIAVRHFNCTDQFYLNVDDFTLTYNETPVTPDPDPSTGAEFLKANVYVRLKSGLSAGTYNGTVTAATTGLSNTLTVSGSVTGSKSIAKSDEMLSVYPNPVERGGMVTVQLPFANETTKVEVFNTIGVLIWSDQCKGMVEIPCSSKMVPGIYTIRATDEEGNVSLGKLIVK